ncbi:MAG: TRAP transporter large permease [Dehalococcoidales bacterium]|jgi:C4-dicarboxylate transporter DctM subunit|nr:TRAP transporter large permease [Dehalococcoidales bacterium]
MAEAALLFGSLIVFIFLGVPIGIAIGLATLFNLTFISDLNPIIITQNAFAGIDSFPLLAIPFFILAGTVMQTGGIARRLLNLGSALIGTVTGGLAMITVVTSMFFAALSGSALATVSAIGSFMIPDMKEKGYDEGFAAAVTAAAGTIGVIIPPSIPFVIYGVVTGTSVGDLFLAGIFPGILIGIGLMITSYVISKKRGYVGQEIKVSFNKVMKALFDAKWAIVVPLIILGGIYAGIFTPTEAAVVASVYSILISAFVYRELTLNSLYKALLEAFMVNGIIIFMVGLSTSFASYLSMQQIPAKMSEALIALSSNKFVVLTLINVILLLIGCFVDNIPATIILSPIFLPIVTEFGITPIQFGIIITYNLAIGFITPPYGQNLFVASAVGGISIGKIFRSAVPFLFSMIIILILLTFVPWFSIGILHLLQ